MLTRKLSLLLIVVLLLLGAFTVTAQDATAAPTLPAEADVSAVVVDDPAPDETTIPDGSVVVNVYVLLGGFIAAIAGGGAGGMLFAGRLATRLLGNPSELKAVEGLASSVPSHIAERLVKLAESMIPVGRLLQEAFDGIPADGKPITTVAHDPTPPVITSAYDPYDVAK